MPKKAQSIAKKSAAPHLIEGFGLTVSLGIFEQSEVDEFMKGILII